MMDIVPDTNKEWALVMVGFLGGISGYIMKLSQMGIAVTAVIIIAVIIKLLASKWGRELKYMDYSFVIVYIFSMTLVVTLKVILFDSIGSIWL
jgi:hypothetical protein